MYASVSYQATGHCGMIDDHEIQTMKHKHILVAVQAEACVLIWWLHRTHGRLPKSWSEVLDAAKRLPMYLS